MSAGERERIMVVDKIFKMQATMFYVHNQHHFLLDP
jgi:hypothetical protein